MAFRSALASSAVSGAWASISFVIVACRALVATLQSRYEKEVFDYFKQAPEHGSEPSAA